MLKVVISGLIYPLTMMRYFWDALEKRSDVELFVTGPFYGSFIPWKGGMKLPERYVKIPDLPLPEISQSIPFALVESRLKFQPDVWIQFDAGWHFMDRPKADVVVLVETDPHVLKEFYEVPKKYSDFTFCMQTPYMREKEYYLPYAYDPDVHYPIPDLENLYDVCLVGLQYTNREAVIKSLRQHGIRCFFDTGPVFDEYRQINNQSKIGFNWSGSLDMNARAWELAAMGMCAVENTVPDMQTFFVPGEHYIEFKDATDAEKQIVLALADDDRRFEIGQAAYRKVTSGKNTYSDRVQQILETIRVL